MFIIFLTAHKISQMKKKYSSGKFSKTTLQWHLMSTHTTQDMLPNLIFTCRIYVKSNYGKHYFKFAIAMKTLGYFHEKLQNILIERAITFNILK